MIVCLFFYDLVLVSYFISATSAANLYLTFNPFPTLPVGNRDGCPLPNLRFVDVTIHTATALAPEVSFTNFEPITNIMDHHLHASGILLPQTS